MAFARFISSFRAVAGALTATVLLSAASPALANSSASVDITTPLRTAPTSSQAVSGGEDEKFRELFSNWQRLEGSSVPALAAVAEAAGQAGLGSAARGSLTVRPSVSIPSRTPLDGVRLTSGYGMRTHPVLGGRRAHNGIDLAAPTGTPVYAAADGLVSRASWFSSYGLYISLEHGNNIQTRYAHLSRLNVADGQRVKKGDLIGFVGSTGRSTGPHLHYEVRIDGKAVNPLPYMNDTDSVQMAVTEGPGGQGGP